MRRVVAGGMVGIVVALVAAAIFFMISDSDVETSRPAALAPAREVPPSPNARRPPRLVDEAPKAPPTRQGEPRVVRKIHGVVRDAAGDPVADATVVIHPQDQETWRSVSNTGGDFAHRLAKSRTASDGAFSVSVEGSWMLLVVVTKDGFAPASRLDGFDRATDLTLVAAPDREFLIVGEMGRPVEGAQLSLLGEEGSTVRAVRVTESDGRARLAAEDGATLLVRAPGFVTQQRTVAGDESGGGAPAPIRVALSEGRQIGGVVVDSAGNPLPDVDVQLYSSRAEHTWDRTHTDARGAFLFDGLDPHSTDETGVLARLGDLDAIGVDAVPGELDVRVVLRRKATIRGVVVFEDGRPAKRLFIQSGCKTDVEGRFELRTNPGPTRIAATADSTSHPRVRLHGAAVVDAPEGGAVDGVRITLAPSTKGSFVQAQVRDADGALISNVRVTAWIDGEVVGDGRTGRNGEDQLSIDAPANSRVLLSASSDEGDACAEKPTRTRVAPPFEMAELRLGGAAVVRLHLRDPDGREIPRDRAEIVTQAAANPAGGYWVRVGDEFRAEIRAQGFATRVVELHPPHQARSDEAVRLAPSVVVRGRVLDVGRRRATRPLRVEVRQGGRPVEVDVDDAGWFEVASLPGLMTELRVLEGDDVVLYREFSAADWPPADLADLRVAPPRVSHGTVTARDGRGLGGAEVAFVDPGGRRVRPVVRTRPDGTFDELVPADVPLGVVVQRRGFATRCVKRAADMSSSPIVLGPPGRVRVCAPGILTAQGRHVEAADRDFAEWTWRARRCFEPGALVDPDAAVYEDLPPGLVEIAIVTQRRRDVRRVHVVEGKTVDCVFK